MKRIISHRGNLNGPNPERENSPSYIEEAIKRGYDVEIDVWYLDGNFYLGHDKPLYPLDMENIERRYYGAIGYFWCHAKNFEALNMMLSSPRIWCFWHQNDDYAVTSNGYIWAHSGKQVKTDIKYLSNISIIVDLDRNWDSKNHDCYGVCTDYVL